MLVEAAILTGFLGIGYRSFKIQKRSYKKKILELQKNKKHKKNKAMQRSKKDMIALSAAMGLSSIGGFIYHPLIYLAPPFTLYAARRRILFAIKQLKELKVSVETLSSLSIVGAVLGQRFFIGALLGFVSTLGNQLSEKVINESQHELTDIYTDIPKNVWLLKDGVEISTPLSAINAGDIIVINSGETIPVDGLIVSGSAGINEHQFTGEAIPTEKTINDFVFAMTLLISGKIQVRVEQAGINTKAMQITKILNDTSDYKSNTVLEAQSLSQNLVKPTLLVGSLTWGLFGFSSAIGMLVAHPKERLQVSSPISLLRYLKYSMDEGILIKDGRSLELLKDVDTIVFDKTGTLTEEKPHIGQIYSFSNTSENEVLRYAGIAEYKQTHPLAHAILEEVKKRQILLSEPNHSEYCLGYGLKVSINNEKITIGSQRFIEQENIEITEAALSKINKIKKAGNGLLVVCLNKTLIGIIELLPTIRAEAKQTIQKLKSIANIKHIYIISGDHEAPTRSLSESLDIDGYFAQTLPEQKAEIIEQLQKDGKFVCFVGDGINDAIAMKQAQVSISLSGASQLATDTAQIILLNSGISNLYKSFVLAKSFHKHMRNQFTMVLAPSIFGASMIVLMGWGMASMMLLNIAGLATTLTYSLVDRSYKKVLLKSNDSQKIIK